MEIKVVKIDCEDPEIHSKRNDELLLHIVREIQKVCGQKQVKDKLGSTPAEIASRFKEIVNTSLIISKSTVLIIFDEIENISPITSASSHWKDAIDTVFFWQVIRSHFQSDKKNVMTYCFVGTNPSLLETSKFGDVANPVFAFAPNTYLSGISLDSTISMCNRLGYFMGMNFPHDVIVDLHRRFGGHAFFIRQACSEIHKSLPDDRPIVISRHALNDGVSNSLPKIKIFMDDIIFRIKQFYPIEYDMLCSLANSNNIDFSELASAFPESVEHIRGYGIIEKSGKDWSFAFSEIERLIRSSIAQANVFEIEKARAEITNRRNNIESSLRREVLYWSKDRGIDEILDNVRSCISLERFNKLSDSYPDIFHYNRSKLYFIEICKIYYKAFSHREELNSFMQHADIINRYRIDAHPADFSNEEFSDTIRSIEYFERIIID